MEALLEWLADYSLGVVLLLVLGGLLVYVGRTVLDRAVSARVELAYREQNLKIERRSAFEDRVLTDRYESFDDLVSRLVSVTTDLRRVLHGEPPRLVPFISGRELVPLTLVYEDCQRHRLLLGAELFESMNDAANVVKELSETKEKEAFEAMAPRWENALARLREVGEEHFGLSKIRW